MVQVKVVTPFRFRAVVQMLLLAVVWAWGARAQQPSLPSTPPTVLQRAAPVAGAGLPGRPQGATRHRAKVVVSGGQIEVKADNSSLNQILREIARQTGMTITGGVRDQRVYGNYGPGPAAEVLSELLEGTETNMILQMTGANGLGELSLTPRTGGPSPPSPVSAGEDVEDARATMVGETPVVSTPVPPPVTSGPSSQVPPLPFSQPAAQPAATDPFVTPETPSPAGFVGPPTVAPATEPGTTPGPATQSTGTSDPGAGTSNPTSPNGVKTPDQIYQELQKLQQQTQPPAQAPQTNPPGQG